VPPAILIAVSTERLLIHVDLEIVADGEPIAGVIRDEHGHTAPFTGWLGLMERLETLRADPEHLPTVNTPQSGCNPG
jgi:hypothetical protein